MVRIPGFLREYEIIDEEMFRQAAGSAELAMKPGALDLRTKLLITLALDTLKGAEEGVRVLAAQAREAGASDDQIREAIRLAYYVAGMDSLKTGLSAFRE